MNLLINKTELKYLLETKRGSIGHKLSDGLENAFSGIGYLASVAIAEYDEIWFLSGGTIKVLLIIIGIILIILSFFIKDTNKKIEKDMEELSFSFYQEISTLKRRMKIIEEELMIENTSKPLPTKKSPPAIHEILKNQVLELHKQGFSMDEISARSSLTIEQIKSVISGVYK